MSAATKTKPLCENCEKFMLDLLDKRIRSILDVSRKDNDDSEEAAGAQAHCFHLMEIQRILRGETTCGVFDDYGAIK